MSSRTLQLLFSSRELGVHLVRPRKVPVAAHVPRGRTLHLVDFDNLVGGSGASDEAAAYAIDQYRRLANVGPADHVILATGAKSACRAFTLWPGAKLVLGSGLNGADNALITESADHCWIARQYYRIVLGSGDGIFATTMAAFRVLGIPSVIVARRHTIAWRLMRAVDVVRYLPDSESRMAS